MSGPQFDLARLQGSRIVSVARLAFGRPDTEFLCFGESDQKSPAAAVGALTAALARGDTLYPDVRGLPALRHALADYLTALHKQPVVESRVMVTASGMAALAVALSAILRHGDRVVLHEPAWPNAGNAARLRGARVEPIALAARQDGSLHLDLDALDRALAGARVFILNSPNNPTGWTATEEELRQILALCRRHGCWLLSDEVYSRLVYDGRDAAPSILDVAEPDDRVIVANSFSKTWVMTGWRLGWLIVPEGVRDDLSELIEVTHSGVAPFIQHAGLAAVADHVTPPHFRQHCAEGRRIAAEILGKVPGIRYASPDGAFYAFLQVEGLTDSLSLAERLVTDHGVAIAPGIAFGESGEGWLRVCFAVAPDRLTRALDRLAAGLKAFRATA
ncbi:pyridoxal phosphate-dependent aminotransferase [Acidisoma cellulosilytica]|uniref:Aminotransferase n=1 Tax=Acidisoma cellulosilyticum TaxID=2802395 RepID=A0A963YXM1_9PROT|nr:pyridoxal phosphate-dependent aminotransferase [Acidisoma cellulosilyticum]MCB8878815.1 pyridoxal phosphate-dependent aminotransferase [Acidisoma cellulosilyticum]